MSIWIPFTPAGTPLIDLQKDTEDEAWKALMSEAARMPYNNKQEFIEREYTVEEFENDR